MASATASRTPGLASDDVVYDGRPAHGPRPMAVTTDEQSRRPAGRVRRLDRRLCRLHMRVETFGASAGRARGKCGDSRAR